MAVPSWTFFNNQGQSLISFELATGDDIPIRTSYMGNATWVAVSSGTGNVSLFHLSDKAFATLHTHLIDTQSLVNWGTLAVPRAVTFDGKYIWVLVDLATVPLTYKMVQLLPRSSEIVQSYSIPTSGVSLVGLCMDGPGWGGENLRGRYFWTIGDNDTIYQLAPVQTAILVGSMKVVETFSVVAGLRATFSDIEFNGKDFWTINQREDRFGTPIAGRLKQWSPGWDQLDDYAIGASWTGLATDGRIFMSRTD